MHTPEGTRAKTRSPSGIFYLALNAYVEALDFELPEHSWRRIVDTSLASPNDIVGWDAAPFVAGPYRVRAHSVVVLAAQPTSK